MKNKQSYLKEIILINDSSNDNTKDIGEKYSRKYKKIKLYNKKFKSLSKSTNFGIKKAKAQWVTKIDADDYVSQNFLSGFIKETKKNFDFLWGNIIKIDESTKKREIINQNFSRLKFFYKYPHGSGTVFKKKLWKTIGGFNENLLYQDDFDFWLKIKKNKDFSLKHLNVANYYYRKHKKNMSNNFIQKNLTKTIVFFKNIL
tara:strand:+ start:330 stop:932 length:603 start_codon:yes stop_codon:yes gene_type:complete